MKSLGRGKRLRSVPPRPGSNEVVKGWRVGHTRRKVFNVPKVAQGLEYRGRTVGLGLPGLGIPSVVFNVALGRIGRNQPGGHAATIAIELQRVLGAVLCLGGKSLVVRANSKRSRDVVVETTSLVIRHQKQALIPMRAIAQSVVNLLDKDFTVRDVAVRVHRVGIQAAARRVDVRQLWEVAQVRILEEVLDWHNAVLRVLLGPVEEQGVGIESAVRAVIVAPGDTLLGGRLEDTLDWDGRVVKVLVVGAVAVRSSCHRAQTVGVCRLSLSDSATTEGEKGKQ